MNKYITTILLYFILIVTLQAQKPKQIIPNPNAPLFEKIREIWLSKEPMQMLHYMDERVKIGIRISTSVRSTNVYAATQAAGILNKHISEIRIIEFKYLPEKMSEDKGVALYRYQNLSNGQEKNSLIYILLQSKVTGYGVTTWLISSIQEVDF